MLQARFGLLGLLGLKDEAFPRINFLTFSAVLCHAVLQARFGLLGLKDEAFPRIKLFKKGQHTAKPVDYTKSMKDSNELLAWTVAQTGVFVGVKVRAGIAFRQGYSAQPAVQQA